MPKSQHTYELSVLEALQSRSEVGQRDLAEATGLSLGMTNIVLKTLAEKGWMKIRRLSSKKMQYLLTPDGMRELTQRTYRYVTTTIRDMAVVREQVEALVLSVRASGAEGLCFVGPSELAFVVEYQCLRHAVPFRCTMEPMNSGAWFHLYGEGDPGSQPNVLDCIAKRLS